MLAVDGFELEAARCLESVELWHSNVHQHDIGMGFADHLERLDAVGGGADDDHVVS